MRRIAMSLLLLPVVVVLLAVAYAALSAQPGEAIEAVSNLRYQALWYAIVTYMSLALLALPLLLLAWKRLWLSWWHAVLAGALVGAVVFLPAVLPTLFDSKLHLHYRLAKLALLREPAFTGALHGLLFWVLALWHNKSVLLRVTSAGAANPQ
jgi:hypothetical protein